MDGDTAVKTVVDADPLDVGRPVVTPHLVHVVTHVEVDGVACLDLLTHVGHLQPRQVHVLKAAVELYIERRQKVITRQNQCTSQISPKYEYYSIIISNQVSSVLWLFMNYESWL